MKEAAYTGRTRILIIIISSTVIATVLIAVIIVVIAVYHYSSLVLDALQPAKGDSELDLIQSSPCDS